VEAVLVAQSCQCSVVHGGHGGAGPGQARSNCGCHSPLVMVSNRSEIRTLRSLPNGEDEGKITEGRRLKDSTTKPEQGRSQLESGDGRREH
jgi:hypothetical protein